MSKYVLSPAAQESLINIKNYSTKTFGKKRTRVYLSSLRNRMKELSVAPFIGLERDDIKKGYLSYYEGSHTIYYRITQTHIEIIDILHQSMEPSLHL
jgi:toxin ParE1/3/4